LKSLLLCCVKTYISVGMFFYFKKIKVRKNTKTPKVKPVLFLANHQNGLLDPLIMAVTSGRYAHFLTRAQVFKKPIVKKILKALQLIPVYRVRDGWKTISNNNAIFSKCISLLNTNDAVTIFPEGSHNLNRTVRPLSKGFTRIVLGVIEANPKTDLILIPVGFNYKNAIKCPDEVLVNYGKPILASNYNLENKNEAINNLKTDVQKALITLTTHIETDNYNKTLKKLENLNANFLDPESVNFCIKYEFKTCEILKKAKSNYLKLFFKQLLIVVCFVPYLVWKKVAQPKIKEIEFTATFRFAIAVTLVPIWLLLVAIMLSVIFSGSIAIYFVVLAFIIALLAVKL